MQFEVKVKRLNENESTFITKDYDNYNPVIKKVNGLEQIGFVKEGKTRMTWTPIGSGELYDHNVKEVIISEATTGRRIDVIVAKHW